MSAADVADGNVLHEDVVVTCDSSDKCGDSLHRYSIVLAPPLSSSSSSSSSSSEFTVRMSTIYRRVPLAMARTCCDSVHDSSDELIDRIWASRLASSGGSLWDAPKFRFDSAHFDAKQACCVFHLGITSYKEYLGTNCSPDWKAYLDTSAEDSQTRHRHMASSLGNGAIVETKDGHVVLLQRGTAVGEAPGLIVFPGGHAEPDEVPPLDDEHLVAAWKRALTLTQNEADDLLAKYQPAIEREFLDSVWREVFEETGLSAEDGDLDTSTARFLGITRRVENARCTAFWCVSAPDLTKHDVEVRYARRSDKHESVRLVCVHKDALPQLAQNSMPGCHRGGAALFLGTFDL